MYAISFVGQKQIILQLAYSRGKYDLKNTLRRRHIVYYYARVFSKKIYMLDPSTHAQSRRETASELVRGPTMSYSCSSCGNPEHGVGMPARVNRDS